MDYEYINEEPCWFEGKCARQLSTGCDTMCNIKREFHYLLHTSNIPEKFKGASVLYPDPRDLEAFKTLAEIKNDVINFVNDGRFLCLWSSNVGNGKSSWTCKILKTYLAIMANGNGFKDLGWFEYVPSLLLLSKDFNNPDRELHIQACKERPFVILDDIGSADLSKYDTSVISDIIDTRYSHNKATIFTSNLNESGLEQAIGVRMADRVLSDICIGFVGGSHRSATNTYVRK